MNWLKNAGEREIKVKVTEVWILKKSETKSLANKQNVFIVGSKSRI